MPNKYHIVSANAKYSGDGHINGQPVSSALYEVRSEEVQDIMSKMRIGLSGRALPFYLL
ncbi:MAG: hypothetical protein WKG06_05900 [Segetibacter sp.]